uniref:Cdc23 domain-containing protein n=1 Tax=Pyrodinium bahamense TaxID=73915 RepID=A0A7S0B8Q5_9DINO
MAAGGPPPPSPLDLGPARRQLLGANGSGPELAGRAGEGGCEATFASLLCKLGTAVHTMHRFESSQAIRLLQELPRRHYRTGYVLGLVALCHFEAAEYEKAEQLFKEVRRIEPRRVEGLEYYSSALWHLNRQLELGHLARQCLQWDRSRPQVWCVVGNCFSLQHEHETAVRFLKRAMQVDESFTYAYTLCGHEFAADDKFDKAMQMYEHALSIDPRHYNAWWGLGNIYNRQEAHENARYHFLKALDINKSNAVLRHYLGMALGSLGDGSTSLDSIDLDEDSATPSPHARRGAAATASAACTSAAAVAMGGDRRQRPRASPVPAAGCGWPGRAF